MELSDYLQGGDILDFINQYLEDLDNKEREENRPKMDFKTAAKLTSMSCGLKRTMSDKAKSEITTSDHKGVIRSKSLKSKNNSSRPPEETRSRSRLDSGIGDDSVFSASRRSTMSDIRLLKGICTCFLASGWCLYSFTETFSVFKKNIEKVWDIKKFVT